MSRILNYVYSNSVVTWKTYWSMFWVTIIVNSWILIFSDAIKIPFSISLHPTLLFSYLGLIFEFPSSARSVDLRAESWGRIENVRKERETQKQRWHLFGRFGQNSPDGSLWAWKWSSRTCFRRCFVSKFISDEPYSAHFGEQFSSLQLLTFGPAVQYVVKPS